MFLAEFILKFNGLVWLSFEIISKVEEIQCRCIINLFFANKNYFLWEFSFIDNESHFYTVY